MILSIHKVMNTNINTQVLNVEQVANIFGVEQTTVREWARTGLIPGYKIGKRWFFGRGAMLDIQSREDALKVLGSNSKTSGAQPYDILIEDNSLRVRVELKSSNLRESTKGEYWRFSGLHKEDSADYYLLLGYNEDRSELLVAYFIPTPELIKYYKRVANPSEKHKFEFKGISIYKNDLFMKGFLLN